MSQDSHSIKDVSGKDDISPVTESTTYRPEVDTSGIDERRLLRRIDFHVVPWLAILYLLNFLDRGNIGNARVRSDTCWTWKNYLHDSKP